jgi:soluble lytic murein transglycosylase
MDLYAFPDIGVPNEVVEAEPGACQLAVIGGRIAGGGLVLCLHNPVGSKLDRCIVYAIERTESGFDQADMSSAKAVGLMQVTPAAGRDTAKRFGVAYDWSRLVSDPIYNTQMGAAEVSALLKDYRGSFILTFAGYNAGRGRIEQWVAQHGDPRDPKVDAVDWVERIPFAETRNYVERVIENLQVYRKRFGDITATFEPNLHRAAMVERRPVPTPAELSVPH